MLIYCLNKFDTLPKKECANLWNSLDFEVAERTLFAMQQKLAAAANDETLIRACQLEILKSLDAEVLAVRHATSTSAGPGVDGVRLSFSVDKMQMAFELGEDIKNYKASHTKLLKVQPKRSKERNIKIPTMYDCALQVLYSYTLAPIAQVKGNRL